MEHIVRDEATSTGKIVNHKAKMIQSGDYIYESIGRLIIPDILIDTDILNIDNENLLKSHAMIVPDTSTPDRDGNTVIIGHRYSDRGGYRENAFYQLVMAKVGQKVYLNYKGKDYVYVIKEVFEAKPEDTWIEDNTDEAMLTIYTCTPLWTNSSRFVIRAVKI